MNREFRTVLAGSLPQALTAFIIAAVTPAGAAAQCDKILPVFAMIDVFESSTAPKAVRQISRFALPADVCRLGRENSRYRITLDGKDVWVATVQFAGIPGPPKPLKDRPDGTPAGVKLGTLPGSEGIPTASAKDGQDNRMVPITGPAPPPVGVGASPGSGAPTQATGATR